MQCFMQCSIYSTSFNQDLKSIFHNLKKEFSASFVHDLIHVEFRDGGEPSNAFIFPYGALVFWNFSEHRAKDFLEHMSRFTKAPFCEPEKCEYTYGEKAAFHDDLITLPNHDTETKIAFSYGLAQSTKLSIFEVVLHNTFEATQHIPESLARTGIIPLSRKEIRKKIGQLFIDRSSINLHLNALDTPEFFWENAEYDPIYQLVCAELDIAERTSTLNQQLDVLHDLFDMLGNELNHQHSSRLEWAIIILIVIEVALVIFHDVLSWI